VARRPSQEDVDADHTSVTAMADRMGLTGEDRDRYIHQHMTKLGYAAERRYKLKEDEKNKNKNDEDSFF